MSLIRRMVGACRPYAHDQKPEHDRQLASRHRHSRRKLVSHREWSGDQQGSKAVDHIGEACNDQEYAQNAGQESRLEYQQSEGHQPKTPKYLSGERCVDMHLEEDHRQGIQLRP